MRGPDVGVGPSSVLVVDWRASGYSAAAGGTACVEAAVCVRVVGDDGQVRYVPLPRDPDAGLSVQDKFVRAVGFWTEATDRKNGLPHQAPA